MNLANYNCILDTEGDLETWRLVFACKTETAHISHPLVDRFLHCSPQILAFTKFKPLKS